MNILKRYVWLALVLLAVSCAGKRISSVQVSAENAKQDESAVSKLIGSYWQVVELNGIPVDTSGSGEREAHIVFERLNNQVFGSGGCNRFSGHYEIHNNKIRISQILSTKMACMNVPYEDDFFRILQTSDSYTVSDDTLKIMQKDSSGAIFILKRNIKQ